MTLRTHKIDCIVSLGAHMDGVRGCRTGDRPPPPEGCSGQICPSKRDICDPCELCCAQTPHRTDLPAWPCPPSVPTTLLGGLALLCTLQSSDTEKARRWRWRWRRRRARVSHRMRRRPTARHSCGAAQTRTQVCPRCCPRTAPQLSLSARMMQTGSQGGRPSHDRPKGWDEAIHSCGPWWEQPRGGRAGRLRTPRTMGGSGGAWEANMGAD